MLTPRLSVDGTLGVTGWVVSSSNSQRYPTAMGVPFPSTTSNVIAGTADGRSARNATESSVAKIPVRRLPGVPAVDLISDLLTVVRGGFRALDPKNL
jgi:hypothetical protein